MDQTEITARRPISSHAAPRRRIGPKTAGSAAVAVVLALGLLWWWAGSVGFLAGGNDLSPSVATAASDGPAVERRLDDEAVADPDDSHAVVTPGAGAAPAEESAFSRKILGEWEQFNKGKRLLTVREDGTATIKVTLDGAWAYVVGEKLEFEIQWKIEGKRLLFNMVGGKPEGSMKIITSMYGKERNHRIETLTEDQMILVDEKDDSHDKWKRTSPARK